MFNSYHDRIRFTVDYNDENGINFLDVKLDVKQEKLFLTYIKNQLTSERYLNYYSNSAQSNSAQKG